MAGISISGLISGSFDWKSVVDQLIQIDSAPITRLNTETADNNNRLATFASLKSGLTDLQTAATALSADGLFNARLATSATSNSSWSSTAANDAATGSYAIAVTRLAAAAQRTGSSGISSGLSATSDVTGVTLATMPTAIAATAGNFTINGATVAVALTDTLKDVFDKISAATGGIVTGSYDSATDKVTFASSDNSEIVMGAGNDTSNFLSALRLVNNGSGSITSSAALGSAALNVPLVNSRLRGSFGAIDGSGNGAFAINGVSISYNVNTDTLTNILSRITASTAGVTATYDNASDRVILTNKSTGDIGIGATDTTGSLLSALGMTTGSALVHGKNALFSVNGGATMSSASNTLDGTTLGISGLTLTVNTLDTQTISVSGNTAKMQTAIENFITNFNTVQDYITSQTAITKGADGKVSAALLANNTEVSAWSSKMRSLAFGAISGLTGTVQRLENLGIDFNSADSTLVIKDQAKLSAALTNSSADVGAFFNTNTTGFAAQFGAFLTKTLDTNSGSLATQTNTLTKENTGIAAQIATLNTRLENERTLLTSAFIAMQNAQQTAQTQQKTLTNMFSSSSSSSSSS